MSLINQRVGSYHLTRKLYADKNYKIYQAIHVRSFEKCIFHLAKLEGKLKKKASRKGLKQKIETLRVTNSPYIIPLQECDFTEIKDNNYFYLRIPNLNLSSLKEWLQEGEGKPLTQQCVDDIMCQAREAVEVCHQAGIAHLNIDLSSFMIETGEGVNRPQIFLRNFLPACLYSERIKEGKTKRNMVFAEDRNALNAMEKLLGRRVEKTSIEHAEHVESPLQALEKRLLILETENEQLQQRLRELEAEKERINKELQEQREREKNRLLQAEAEKKRFILDQQQWEERDDKLLAGAMLASTTIRGADASPTILPGKSSSRLPQKRFLVSGCLLFLAALFAGTSCLFAGLFFFGKPVLAYFDSSTARVTITQASYALTDNYVFTGVSRSISKAQTQSITAPATNLIVIAGKKAIGTLTFHNTQSPCNIARIIPAGTLFTNSHGISVATDKTVTLGTSCNASAPAHAVKIGPYGNIGAHSVKQTYHATVIVDNPVAFIGGQFAQSYTTVQQSDIDHARNSLERQVKQEALSGLHAQLQANEQYTSLPACTSKAISDHQAYDIATQVTVVVTVVCTAEAYKPQEIISQSQQMLNTRAQALFGPGYMLSGNIHSTITHVATDAKHDTLITTVASGLWTYQVSRARTDQLAQLLTGMDKQDAQYTISRQKGVQSVSISISNNGNTMPSKANSIHIAYVTSLVMVKVSQSKV